MGLRTNGREITRIMGFLPNVPFAEVRLRSGLERRTLLLPLPCRMQVKYRSPLPELLLVRGVFVGREEGSFVCED